MITSTDPNLGSYIRAKIALSRNKKETDQENLKDIFTA